MSNIKPLAHSKYRRRRRGAPPRRHQNADYSGGFFIIMPVRLHNILGRDIRGVLTSLDSKYLQEGYICEGSGGVFAICMGEQCQRSVRRGVEVGAPLRSRRPLKSNSRLS